MIGQTNYQTYSAQDGGGPSEDEKPGPGESHPGDATAIAEHQEPNTNSNGENPRAEKRHWLDYATAVFALVAALGSISAVVVGVLQWIVMGGQQSIMQADHRPWVSAFPINIVGNLTHSEAGLQITMQFTLKNTGHSPSRAVFVSFTPSLGGSGQEITHKVCTDSENSMLKLNIFPGDTVIQSIGGLIPETEFTRYRDDAKNGNFGLIDTKLPSITACIAYKDMEADAFHHTSYTFYISKAGSDASPLRTMLDENSIPSSDLMLVSLPIYLVAD